MRLDIPSAEQAFETFQERFPAYRGTSAIDTLRAREFERLDSGRHVYVDYTGSGLYAASQVSEHARDLLDAVLGNPHSISPTSLASTERVERCRRYILEFFRADPIEYSVVFTANASHALKLVGESYPFGCGDRFLLTFDNHNSVNGIREFDRARGAETVYVPMVPPDLRVDETRLLAELEAPVRGSHKLFAYPAQSNFSGVQHPLDWVRLAHDRGWDVLLDAAAFVPTNPLDLSSVRPDFVAMSFYKMFGYPTGVGALIARTDSLSRLHRPWFAGGTIDVASVQADRFVLSSGAPAFEDGTLDFANIAAVETGLRLIAGLGYDVIHERVHALTGWMLSELSALHHDNGRPLVKIYGPCTPERRGGTITFNIHDASGAVLDHRAVEASACERRISLRTGCFCNPGAGEVALGLSRGQLETCFGAPDERMTYDDLRRCIDPNAAGAVRISFGLVSSFGDAYTLLDWARGFLNR